jgi:hypothetical protein
MSFNDWDDIALLNLKCRQRNLKIVVLSYGGSRFYPVRLFKVKSLSYYFFQLYLTED